MLSGCKKPWLRLGPDAVVVKPGCPIVTASWPGVTPWSGATATSTWLTLYLGEVKPAVSSIVEPPAPGALLPAASLWCWLMTRNQVIAKAAV